MNEDVKMNDSKLRIIISGGANTGKSAIAREINDVLQKQGFNCVLDDEDALSADKFHREKRKESIIRKNTKIFIETQQVRLAR